jgi:hypothetical protein
MPTENHEGCDHELIEAVVMGNVIDEQRSDQLIRHLNHCDRCRDQIDSLSAASQREASELLKQQPFDDESDSGADDSQAVSIGDATVSLPVPLSVRSVLNSLAFCINVSLTCKRPNRDFRENCCVPPGCGFSLGEPGCSLWVPFCSR